ncbi:MAG: N-acetylmuramoyl-L-alanine amidase [Alphaproteobacteria bacterium]
MKKCVLVIGHNAEAGDRGARGADGTMEHDWNLDIANPIAVRVKRAKVIVEHYRKGGGNVARFNAHDADLVLELHCNADATGKASGTEVLYAKGSVLGVEYAKTLLGHLLLCLNLPNRYVRPIGQSVGPDGRDANGYGGAYLLWGVRAPALIAEPFFISNPADQFRANSRKRELFEAYAAAIDEIVQ